MVPKTSVQRQSYGRKQIVDERSKENGKNCASYKQANNCAVQQCCAERHLGAHNTSILVTDGLLQHESMAPSCLVSIIKAVGVMVRGMFFLDTN